MQLLKKMMIYSPKDLYNKYVRGQAFTAVLSGCVSKDNYTKILSAYPCRLYTPNFFIRIALGLLTIVAAIFSGLLIGLVFESSGQGGITALFLFFAIATYILLELLVSKNRYFNAG